MGTLRSANRQLDIDWQGFQGSQSEYQLPGPGDAVHSSELGTVAILNRLRELTEEAMDLSNNLDERAHNSAFGERA